MWQVFDQFGNHVEEGTELNVHVDGMSFLDKQCSVQKVIVSHNVRLSSARQQGLNRCVSHIYVWFQFIFQFFESTMIFLTSLHNASMLRFQMYKIEHLNAF